MGYIRHHAIVVTTYSEELSKKAHAAANLFLPTGTITEIQESPINKYFTFFVGPDGSKEGWPESNDGDRRRESFIAWLDRHRYSDGSTSLDWAEVQYGDDDGENKVCRDDAHTENGLSIGDDYRGPSELEL